MANKKPNRLDKIYTRSGDSGKTSLALGKRLYKYDTHIKALGDIDELNCQIGIVSALIDSELVIAADLKGIQNSLFDVGAELAMNNAEFPEMKQSIIDDLEKNLDLLNEQLPTLKEFILPGGSLSAAQCHLARAVCRRAERHLVQLAYEGNQSTQNKQDAPSFNQAIKYINRLSDYLFVLARHLNVTDNVGETLWQSTK